MNEEVAHVNPQDNTDRHEALSSNSFHVLLALQHDPLHGYAIMKRVEETSGASVGPGAVYGTIQRLEEAGFIHVGRRREPARGSHPRQEYEISDAGLAILRAEARRLADLTRLVAQRNLLTDGEEP